MEAYAAAPLLHRAPRGGRAMQEAVWLYLGHLGGGYLPGDRVEITLAVDPGATLVVLAQASAKVFPARRNDAKNGANSEPSGGGVTVITRATVAAGATLVLLPDPVVPYADAHLEQMCMVHADPSASILLWDPFTAGRTARGERWKFERFSSRTMLAYGDAAPMHNDALVLDRRDGSVERRVGAGAGESYEGFGSLLVGGPRFSELGAELLAKNGRSPTRLFAAGIRAPRGRSGAPLVSARLATRDAGDLSPAFREKIGDLTPYLGDDPFARKF